MRKAAHSVQCVVPAATVTDGVVPAIGERAVPAEGASLRAALVLAENLEWCLRHNKPASALANSIALTDKLKEIVYAKRSREAPGGNAVGSAATFTT